MSKKKALLWLAIVLGALGGLSLSATASSAVKSNIAKSSSLVKVINVNVWAYDSLDYTAAGPNSQGVDVYSVLVENAGKSPSVNLTLQSIKHGHVSKTPESVMLASDGQFVPDQPVLTWAIPLAPGTSKTVVFIVRDDGFSYLYCAGGTFLKPQVCNH